MFPMGSPRPPHRPASRPVSKQDWPEGTTPGERASPAGAEAAPPRSIITIIAPIDARAHFENHPMPRFPIAMAGTMVLDYTIIRAHSPPACHRYTSTCRYDLRRAVRPGAVRHSMVQARLRPQGLKKSASHPADTVSTGREHARLPPTSMEH